MNSRDHDSEPLVSICVPTYNGEQHLVECFDSICAQTLGDFEVVIVDDASADSSPSIAEKYAQRDPRFRLHRNAQRLGLVGNWNHSLELSRGAWIKLLFQDDLIDSRCLERLVAGCQQRGQRFGFCRRHMLFDNAVTAPTREFFTGHQQWLAELYGPEDGYLDAVGFSRLTAKHLGKNLVGEPTVTLFHRSLIGEYGLFVPQMIQTCDAEYWTRLATNVGVVHVAEPLATFRVHAGSTTSRNSAQREYAVRYLDSLIAHYLFLHEKNYAALRRELFRNPGRLVNWWRLLWAAHEAWKVARDPSANPQLLAEWAETVKRFPRLKSLAQAGRLLCPLRSGLSAVGLGSRRGAANLPAT